MLQLACLMQASEAIARCSAVQHPGTIDVTNRHPALWFVYRYRWVIKAGPAAVVFVCPTQRNPSRQDIEELADRLASGSPISTTSHSQVTSGNPSELQDLFGPHLLAPEETRSRSARLAHVTPLATKPPAGHGFDVCHPAEGGTPACGRPLSGLLQLVKLQLLYVPAPAAG
jgi:hypothetical protein